ncbi:CHAT domain-containing protein [Streptomyces boninensis]|uniref:CHAT domain-containing protein n=1 Tax=Streptomyces boninensis TaxID=2039455 RepID=UPI003B227C1D
MNDPNSAVPDEAVLTEIVQLVADRWAELPAFYGKAWHSVVGEVAGLIRPITDGLPPQRAVAVLRLGRLLRAHPALAAAFGEATAPTRNKADRTKPEVDRAWSTAVTLLATRVQNVLEQRQVNVVAPRTVTVGTRAMVTVDLPRSIKTIEAAATGATTYIVVLTAPAYVVRVDGPPRGELTVQPDDDGPALVFPIVGLATGSTQLTFDVLHRDSGRTVTVIASVDVVSESVDTAQAVSAARGSAVVAPPRMRAAGIELRIRLDDRGNSPELLFELHAPDRTGFHSFPAGTRRLHDSPEKYRRDRLHDFERARTPRQQRQVGEQLWRDLVPDELRGYYLDFREAGSMQITSDEPWIPWEAVRPFEQVGGRTVVDDEPWCLRFELTRWLSSRHPAPDEVSVASFAFLDGSNSTRFDSTGYYWAEQARSNEPAAPFVRERGAATALFRRAGLRDLSPTQADAASVDAVLTESASHLGLWHVLGHGDSGGVCLADGTRWRPTAICGPIEAALAQRRPLFVFNVCRSAHQNWGLAGLAGWAETLVRRCGSPLVGTQWSVTDQAAADMLLAFYRGLAQGETVGKAMRCARHAVRESQPEDSSWLAYTAYAHPHTRVVVGN